MPGQDRIDTHHKHLRRGFNWLGGAMVIAKATDLGTILVVLLFLTKEQLGIASLVVAIGTVIEALDGLGTNVALVQTPALSALQLDSVFWCITVAALGVAGVTLVGAPWLGALYGGAAIAPYFLAVAIKQPLVGAAVIPLALMSRDLQYERIAIVNVGATFATALTRIGLAVLGAGAWALVAAYAASGLFTLIGALLARPYRPRIRFKMTAAAPLLAFGVRAATSNLFEQLLNNVDYLLVGWFYGPAPLAVYRVAFDVAMQPAIAVGTLINRAALPVFAKVARVREHLAPSLTWSLRRVAIMVAPLAVSLILAAGPITALIHDGQGRSYAAAGIPLVLLAAATVPRILAQLIYPLLLGSGRPKTAMRLSAVTLLLLSAGFALVGFSFSARTGIVGFALVWLTVYPLLLLWETRYLHRHWAIGPGRLARALAAPLIATGLLVTAVELARRLIGGGPWLQLALVLTAAALTYGGIFLHERQTPQRTV
ncbi:MAG: oligosaccharide flippase family protein [Steroidobacteraceae bacterium]